MAAIPYVALRFYIRSTDRRDGRTGERGKNNESFSHSCFERRNGRSFNFFASLEEKSVLANLNETDA